MILFSSSAHRQKWDNFLNRHDVRNYKKGDLILSQGETPSTLRIIKKGVVRTYDIDTNGEEHTISFDNLREVFPIGWAFEKIEKTQYFYKAFTDCEIYLVSRQDFRRFLRLNPKMGYELYADMASRFVNLQKRINSLEQSKAADKVIRTIDYLCERFGSKTGKNTMEVKLALTQQELSDFIGLTRETTSLELKKLENDEVLKYKNKNYSVNLERLRDLVE